MPSIIPETIPNLINGQEVQGISGRLLEKFNPADGTLLCRLARSGREDIEAAVEAAPIRTTRLGGDACRAKRAASP